MKTVFCVVLIMCTTGLGQPILKDQNVTPVNLSQLDNFETPEDLWYELNNLLYWEVPLNIPDSYYEQVDLQDKISLRESLHKLIENHKVFPYTHPSLPAEANYRVDSWDIIALADAHPIYIDKVLDVYLNGTFDRQLKGTNVSLRYDREHSWPKSLGFKKDVKKNPAYSDCHHLYSGYQPYNSSRSNKPFGEKTELTEEYKKITLLNINRGGSEGSSANYSFPDIWQTWVGRRGDLARTMFYMELRYDGYTDEDRKEADLQLTDSINLIVIHDDAWLSGHIAYMGLTSILLKWHKEDPVDDMERRRNTIVYLFQKNRNPFIDHPEWVEVLYDEKEISAASSIPVLWINEIHYENEGEDIGEFVEIAGRAGINLSGWRLIAYNGVNGLMYKSLTLSGEINDEAGTGYGASAFDFEGLQNGPADGIALISPDGELYQFITYEGILTAGDGPLAGEISEALSISEEPRTLINFSLQLRGNGNKYKDFRWEGPDASSRNKINFGQILIQ